MVIVMHDIVITGIYYLSTAVISGGFIGSTLGATKLNSPALRVLLGVMLVFAGLKLVI